MCNVSRRHFSRQPSEKACPGCFSGSQAHRECDLARRQGVYEPESRVVQCLSLVGISQNEPRAIGTGNVIERMKCEAFLDTEVRRCRGRSLLALPVWFFKQTP